MSKLSLTESHNPNTTNIDLMDSIDIARIINKEDQRVALAIEKVLPSIAQAIDMIASSFEKGGRLAYFGAGTSGRLGILDASEMLPTFGVPTTMVQGFIAGGEKAILSPVENAEDSADFALKDIETFAPTDRDIVVVISASGNPRYCMKVLEEAKKNGVQTIAVSSNPEAGIGKLADVFINPVVGEEVITGSSRMKSGTAQKMILNTLTTGAMIKIGKTYKNYMIDLQLTNQKLVERGTRFISEICDISHEEASLLLKKTKNVKTACVMCLKQCTKEEAEKMLAQHHGILRKVL